MAPTYCVVKLFQKATFERLKKNLDGEDAFSPENEDLVIRCRICLKLGTVPIFSDDGAPDISGVLQTFSDVPVSRKDGYPKYLCKPCYRLLKGAILLRKNAKKTYRTLRKIVKPETPNETPSVQDNSHQNTSKGNKNSKATLIRDHSLPVETDDKGNIIVIDPSKTDLLQMPKVQCQVCFKIIAKSYFKQHFSLHEVNPIQHVCDVCGKSFRLRTAYRSHMFTHSTEFPYKCQYCPYRARHSGLLKTHMRTHIQDYKYKCTECPAKFLVKCNLNRHSLRHKVPMFQCGNCQKMFHTRIQVDRHFEIEHLGIKKHTCELCGKSFGYRKAMMRHQLEVHKREKKTSGRTPTYLEFGYLKKEHVA